MLDTLNYEEFAAQIGSVFSLADAPEPLELTLAEISERRRAGRQEYFSLLFRGGKSVLPQSIYQLRHEQLGAGELFLVPVGIKNDEVEYEAAFNRLIEN